MASESEGTGGAIHGTANSPKNPATGGQVSDSSNGIKRPQYGHIRLDISNSVLPLDKLSQTSSAKDGLTEEEEMQIRSLGSELIQLAGKLLRLPQVAMATGCVLFQRFYYAKSLVRIRFEEVSMACICLACKIEESPRRIRDIINVFHHIKQIRSGKPITPVVLDNKYIEMKNGIISAERRILKELGFCVHVKHPHKIIVMYLKWLELDKNRELLQMSWNFMNDSLRTDVFVRYPPETIAVACIYLSARKLKEPLPKNPSWFEVLGVEEDDIKDCCYRMICLYNRKKANFEDLEGILDGLRRKRDEDRRAAREQNQSSINTPSQSSPTSRAGSPTTTGLKTNESINTTSANSGGQTMTASSGPASDNKGGNNHHQNGRNNENSDKSNNDFDDRSPLGNSNRHKKKHKHRQRSRSRSASYDDYNHRGRDHRPGKKGKKRSAGGGSRSPSSSPVKKRKHGHHHHKDKSRYRSRSRDRHTRGRGGVASIGLHDESPRRDRDRTRDRGRDSRDRGHDRKNRDYRR